MLLLILAANSAHAQTTETTVPAQPAWHTGSFVDIGYLEDFNNPQNHLFRTRGTTPRVDEFALNMAAAYVRKTPTLASGWGLEATVQGGQDSKTFGFSPTAPTVSGAGWLRHLGPTDVSYLIPAGRGVTVQGGIFSSLIGYDSLYAKDNFTYTRPWCADFTPYLMIGANIAYPVADKVAVTGFVINSYFHLSHPNSAPSVGGQLAYTASSNVSVKETVLTGSHQTDTSFGSWRVLSDTIVERKAGRLTIAGELQLATETLAETGERASWSALQFPVHIAVKGPWSISLRPELAHDPSGRYTGVQQTVTAFTSGVEYRAGGHGAQVIARFEYRYDHSTGPEGGFYSGTSNDLVPGQPLLIGALILTFEHSSKVQP
jgi:putative OmpL-like beta-barrel porin-2